MNAKGSKDAFVQQLRRALFALYDPRVLKESPLLELFRLDARCDPSAALRAVLSDTIESLRPGEEAPIDSRIWRVYQILRRRYIEQLTQQEVASDLGLSVRQLQREERVAREVLGDLLWNTYDLEARAVTGRGQADEDAPSPSSDEVPTRDQELSWLQDSVTSRDIDLLGLVKETLEVLEPLRASLGIEVACEADDNLPPVHLKPPLLRQALLNVITATLSYSENGSVDIRFSNSNGRVDVAVRAKPGETSRDLMACVAEDESLEMAKELVTRCNGHLDFEVAADETLGQQGSHLTSRVSARLTLPAAEQITVLVVDDNADVLQLFERYMTGTRYRFVGTQSAPEGLELARTTHPQIIVLDVMMPGRDGWTLLGQLREHPDTRDIPVIVCTILSQTELAMVLGAADFVRKPVNRSEFLEALGHQTLSQRREYD